MLMLCVDALGAAATACSHRLGALDGGRFSILFRLLVEAVYSVGPPEHENGENLCTRAGQKKCYIRCGTSCSNVHEQQGTRNS